MNITIITERYDYFAGASRRTYETYTNLCEGWAAYKAQRKHDFDYGDAYQHTSCYGDTTYPATTAPQRPHARSAYEWERMQQEKKQRDAMKALTELFGHAPTPIEAWECNEMFADLPTDLWDMVDETARKEEENMVANVVLAEDWDERLHLLSRYNERDPIAQKAVAALCNHLGCRVVYIAGPEYVMCDGEEVFGYAYSLYADGELVAHCEEC